jgi:N-acetylglutamate synthase-like GNAT family acetyltransferase
VRRPGEKEFYLDEFRQRTLVLALDRSAVARVGPRRRLASVVAELVQNRTRVVVVLGAESRADGAAVRRWLELPERLRARRSPLGGRAPQNDIVQWESGRHDDPLGRVWQVLRGRDLCLVVTGGTSLSVAGCIASRMRALKLVLMDTEGGLREKGGGTSLSYLDGPRLEVLLAAGEAESRGLGRDRDELTAIVEMLDAGVGSVNLCRAEDLAHELFTYEGAGTFFSRDDHLHIGRLSIDDFAEVERLLARGQEEGLLKPRGAGEVGELLFDGYGAWIGAHHLGGVASLRRAAYRDAGAAEIAGLYAITRFKGEGIGMKLVQRMLHDARADGLAFVFSVTTAERAAAFFLREGFVEVASESLPSAKWQGYDGVRRARVRAFRYELHEP